MLISVCSKFQLGTLITVSIVTFQSCLMFCNTLLEIFSLYSGEGRKLCNIVITHQWLKSCPYLADLLLCFLVNHWQLHDLEIDVFTKASLGQLLCLQKSHRGLEGALDF